MLTYLHHMGLWYLLTYLLTYIISDYDTYLLTYFVWDPICSLMLSGAPERSQVLPSAPWCTLVLPSAPPGAPWCSLCNSYHTYDTYIWYLPKTHGEWMDRINVNPPNHESTESIEARIHRINSIRLNHESLESRVNRITNQSKRSNHLKGRRQRR